ncbi:MULTISPECIES: PilW family protein [Francisella]|uniref:Prepilin-type N-terminal cleavage/methylation domain-containing protein n=1 Tax=Francisella opportunistica TaxID=2016517 RepID=A0A345JSX3_9GAMM|nr:MULTISPECIES: prepilin-type N-terminal cleavage/methylation domain-containing protein [Francisella]APC92199.1 putative membrane protein [Francisella sp. MA067296]AXH30419.1 prepilin-type N-terminal cleavage/methylation domain-containing protein [Francisella opportunistica]AXH32059.1 prepilin-type cleavage/methylation domain-containing protein [Francisella opportunistica]AXH33707.1 prepilin-type cleavage/methylation domain-containing protein [Francisella opportunistica]
MAQYSKKNLNRESTRGFTLVELMVAVTISAIVIVMAINIYFSAKKNYQKTKLEADQDIKALTTKKIFYDAIINAGLSCKYGAKQQYINRTAVNQGNANFIYNGSAIRVGEISNITNFIQNSLGDNKGFLYQNNTNYIMIKSEKSFTSLASRPINLSLPLATSQQWHSGDYLALCNNDYVDIVKVASIDKDKSRVNLVIAPANEFDRGDYVGKFSVQIFYIAAIHDQKNSQKIIYSLYMYNKEGSKSAAIYPLIEGVSNLNISYSILNKDNLIWKHIIKDTDVDDLKIKALKISFRLNDKYFEKIILL